ncbi:MAG: helix-turn-helix transcriptional regulator [Cyclobacteriaceae bacterium]|nr:helix-turn-helix transcriptional regulator [Cyclobacteriaceae bacterium HetDA_MAG_MS6]
MGRLHLGEFEEIVLLIVAILHEEAYAVAIKSEIANQTERKANISAVHKALYRLEEKGMLQSFLSDPVAKRGGKRRRLFRITPIGKKALDESKALRANLHNQIPAKAFQWSQ